MLFSTLRFLPFVFPFLIAYNGLAKTSASSFYIQDTIAPIAIASVDTVFLDSTGNAVLTANVFGANSTDNVGIEKHAFLDTIFHQLGQDIYGQNTGDYSGKGYLSGNGKVLAVGSGNYGSNQGQVRIFELNGNSWNLRENIIGAVVGDQLGGFGLAMPFDGGRLIVGIPSYSDASFNDRGRTIAYHWNDSDYVQAGGQKLGAAPYSNFGWRVAISGNGLVMASAGPGLFSDTGYVRVYEWNGTTYTSKGSIIEGDTLKDRFGRGLSLSENGNTIAIGAPHDYTGTNQTGDVRVYDWNGSSWVQRGSDIIGSSSGDLFGSVVSISNDGQIVAISAPGNDDNGNDAGQVKVFKWTNNQWLQLGNSINGIAADDYTYFASLSGNGEYLSVGAKGNDSAAVGAGMVRVFRFTGIVWTQIGNSFFGDSANDQAGRTTISNDGATVSVGYHAAGTTAKPYAGLVRVFNRQINSLQFTCADIGQHWVTLWVADSADNTDQHISSIHVIDTMAPILYVQDAFLYPDTGTTTTISLSDVLLSSYDNCGIASITFSDSIFSLADAGANPVVITAIDVNGNITMDSVNVWVAETQRPTANTKDTTLYLDQNGSALLAAATMDNGSFDNMGIAETKILDTTFTQLGATIPGYSINDEAGFVDISANGQVMAIGAPRFSGVRTLSGHVRVFDWADTAWVMHGTALELEGEHAQDQSGSALALSADGNILAIGAYRNDDGGNDAGHARVFYWDGTNWVQRGIDLDGNATGDQFGYCIDLSGDGNKLIVGARYANNNAGAVYRYYWNGNNYQLQGTYQGNSTYSEQLGTSVSISPNGEYVALGGTGHNQFGTNAGAVKVYKTTGPGSLAFKGYVYGQNANDKFGTSVSISDDGLTLAVGAPGNDSNGTNAGSVHVYTRNGTIWSLLGSVLFGKNPGDQFGQRVSLSANGKILAVGASDFAISANDSGYAQVYTNNGTDWESWGSTMHGTNAGDNAHYVSLSASGARLALGSWKADAFGTNSGEVRVFEPLKFDTLQYQCHNTNFDFVPLYVADASKNADVAIGSLSVLDTLKPSAVAIDLILRIGLPGFIDIDVDDVDSASTDNCEIVFRSITDSSFTSLDSGIIPVVLTIIDASGNVGIDTSWVTVIPPDTIPPIAVTTPQHVYLNNTGTGILQATTFGANSTDNYGIAQYKLVDVNQLGQTLTGIAQGDNYGDVLELSADGNTLAISTGTTTAANRYVEVYSWMDTAWVQKGADFTNNNARIGQCLSLSSDGNTLAIGTGFGSNSSGYYTKIYAWNGTTWVQKGDSISNVGIQSSVSLSADGNTVLVGDGSQTGSARVFTYNTVNSIWEQKGSSVTRDGLNPGLGGWANFGKSGQMAADGKSFIVSAPGVYSYNTGWAHVVTWDNTLNDWVQKGNYFTGINAYDRYGTDVSINNNGNIVAISSSNHQVGNKNGAGHVQIFEWDGTQWNQLGSDIEGNPSDAYGENLGSSIQLSAQGNLIAVGSSNKNYLKGKVQSYGYISGQWTAIGQAINASNSGSSQLGKTVGLAADGSRFAAGAPWKAVGTTQTVGTVGVYSLLNDSLQYTCADIDTITETLWVEDAEGNADFAMDTIIVLDTLGPSLITQDITVILDANYQAFISVADIDTGSFDNCQLDSLYLDMVGFTCNHLGTNTVTLTGVDVHGNMSQTAALVTVIDTVFPVAQAKNVTIYLDGSGSAVLTAADVDSFSTDMCLIDSLHLSQSSFSCADLGTNSVTLFVTDGSGNVDSTNSIVTVLDSIKPTAIAAQDIIVGSCNAMVSFTIPSFSDNCMVDSVWQSAGLSSGSMYPIGTTTNTFIAMDESGNSQSTSFNITVIGPYLPTLPPLPAICENDPPFDLSGGDTTIQFSGGSVTLNAFDPGQAGSGNHVVNYVFTDTLGCQTSDSLLITVEPAPAKPTINTSIAGFLSTQTASRYQWYRDGILLSGDTLQSYAVVQSGFHQVRVWNAVGCSEISDSSQVTIGLIERETIAINVYPNPSTGRFILDLTSHSGLFNVMVYNQAGQLVQTDEVHGAQKASLDLSVLKSGTYHVVLKNRHNRLSCKVIIEK